MPPDERITKTAERCDLHPGSPSVARCGGCGRPLCLVCAVPVRGRVLGTECLAAAIGPDAPPGPVAGGDGRPRGTALVGAAFAVAAISTLLPWSRFGEGSGAFGAWGRPRWSVLAAIAALVGLALWTVVRRRALRSPAWNAALTALAAIVAVGALLAVLRPPSFTHASLVPWLTAASGAAAFVASLVMRRSRTGTDTERDPTPPT